MVKHLHSVLTLVLGFFSVAASAQAPATVTKPDDGYYRIVNARQRTDGKQYVYVTGKYAAQPNATKADATTLPGTVIHLKTDASSNNANWLDVTMLRSQGVDVINGYLNPAIEKVEKAVKDKLIEKLGAFRGSIASGLFNTSVIGQWDLKMHLKPVTTSDGRTAYYAFATVPSMQPICDLWSIVKSRAGNALDSYPNLKAALDRGNPDDVWYEIERLALAKIESSPNANADIVNVIKHYIGTTRAENRINQGQTYYLMSGALKKIDNGRNYNPSDLTNTSHNEYEGTLPKFDFVNNNNTDTYFGPELPVTGDAAMWILEKVDDTNYFGVKPSTNMRGRDGKYYTTLYVDFPFQIKGDVKAYTIEGVEAKNADGYYFAKVKKLAQQGDVVPAQTAVVLECNSTNPADNQLLPTGDEKPKQSNNRLCGTFFGESINGLTVKDGTGAERNVTHDNIRAFNINTADSRNPIGFYKLNNTVTTIPGNKAFLVLTNAEAQAKGFVLEFEDGGTTGIETIENSKHSTEDGIYYDLQGRRVENPTRGVYIVNGKKVVIK
ncbi:hypothetical protein [Prevotella melaninogenica]|jgi:hypothetical protein|uniref:hypothetical protein n=1 Tax=Prevotella melaninogenica TaxID=28132 RepID=UPI0001AE9DC9|nr:hypothetical protein [Prevotella melaninogenica]ADK96525.1 hypothetical protein HMPREF0659_A6017 [Prevotella melaninogenica ATCC 25845]ASE17549.1 hypothetical protein CEP85_05390 [Prevotella melaninogenica]MBW4762515.1 hypothetical protein [Prevotella melaninogenica]UEB08162.1 hypothetical protein LK441_01615 [Prevotella melaninogenica]